MVENRYQPNHRLNAETPYFQDGLLAIFAIASM